MTRFVTAFNQARDMYMLPLALHERGMLEVHLTDFYSPAWLARSSSPVLGNFRKRHQAGLPFSKTRIVPQAAKATLGLTKPRTTLDYMAIDRSFGQSALKVHERTGANLFLHSGYAAPAFAALRDRDVIKCLFQYHPHALSSYDILQADLEKHPEVAWSFANEVDTDLPFGDEGFQAAMAEWTMADRIYTASTFTKQSLILQGCDPDRIVVSPYGADVLPHVSGLNRERQGECNFLFVGQGVQRKGLHHLLKAWKAASLKHSRLTIIARKLDPGLRGLLDQPGITYLPGVDDEGLDRAYRLADVFVMPSLVEGFGLVYPEALARGLFCIGTANTGLPDIQGPLEISRIVQPGDIDGLTQSLLDAEHTWSGDGFDRQAIARSIAGYTWQQHRQRITDDLQAWIAAR